MLIVYFVFSDFRPSSLEKVQELMRLRIYQAYAWGVPLIIMTIAIILDNLPNGDLLRPRFGQTRCGFDGKWNFDKSNAIFHTILNIYFHSSKQIIFAQFCNIYSYRNKLKMRGWCENI